jgi:cysteinyl-tRNA synthetase
MPWQDSIEVTDELMKAVTSWEEKMNNFFLKVLEVRNSSSSRARLATEQGMVAADQQLLSSLKNSKTQCR